MYQSTSRQQIVVALLLLGLMILTRFHHFGSVTHLPDASWAIFIAGGFFLRRWSLFLLFMASAVVIDYLAITQFGVSAFCVSSAYGFLLPAHGALWLGGRWLGDHFARSWRVLPLLAIAVVVSAAAAFLISSGSFYWLSGRVGEASLTGFAAQTLRYFPWFLAVTAGYVSAIAVVWLAVDQLGRFHRSHLPGDHA